MLCYAMLHYVKLHYAMLSQATLCYIPSQYIVYCFVKLCCMPLYSLMLCFITYGRVTIHNITQVQLHYIASGDYTCLGSMGVMTTSRIVSTYCHNDQGTKVSTAMRNRNLGFGDIRNVSQSLNFSTNLNEKRKFLQN